MNVYNRLMYYDDILSSLDEASEHIRASIQRCFDDPIRARELRIIETMIEKHLDQVDSERESWLEQQ